MPAKPVLLEMAKFFDVGITPGENDTITHTLSTTLIGADGKVVEFYPGNEWTTAQVLADVEEVGGERGLTFPEEVRPVYNSVSFRYPK